ncbi:MAG: hypothetical protein ABI543_07460, partial [Ignavibacteria bacterium]
AVSLWLFYHKPGLYFKSVIRAYSDFWLLPNFIEYWDINKIRFKILRPPADYWMKLELFLWLIINSLFILGSIFFVISGKYRNWQDKMLLIYLISTVISLSAIQALVQYGDNWRFSVGIKPFIILTLLIMAHNLRNTNKRHLTEREN